MVLKDDAFGLEGMMIFHDQGHFLLMFDKFIVCAYNLLCVYLPI